jgi:DNA polymerase I
MVTYVDTKSQYDKFISWLKARTALAVDTETAGLDPLTDELLLIQVGNGSNQFVLDYIRLKMDGVDFGNLKSWLEDPTYIKVFHNAKFDYKMLKHHLGCEIEGIVCTFVIEHILKKGLRQKGFGLADVAKRYTYADLDKGTRITFVDHVLGSDFTEEQIKYSAEDVEYLLDIYAQQQQLLKDRDMLDLAKLECNAVAPTGDMELNGIYLSEQRWRKLFTLSEQQRSEAEINLYAAFTVTIPKLQSIMREVDILKGINKLTIANEKKLAKLGVEQSAMDFFDTIIVDLRELADSKLPAVEDYRINLDSPAQMSQLLSLHLDREIKSTKEDELLKIKDPIIDKIIALRKATKLCTTYGEEFLRKAVHPITGRIHTNFNQTRADSGRYSSSKPVNLQNIPNRTEYRAAFMVQEPDWRMICADYSGCELRLIAEICDEPSWIEAFKNDYDMHSYVASLLFKIPYETIVDENNKVRPKYKSFRSKAKSVNFGVAYGMGAGSLAQELGVSTKDARKLLNKFWHTFPNIAKTLKRFAADAIAKEYAISPLDKRRRYLKTFDFDVSGERAHAENIAKNLPFQGASASITKRALVLIRRAALNKGWKADQFRILITVHDEVEADCHESIAEEATQMVEDMMVTAAEYYVKKVPMKVDVDVGDHWIH